jgi:16S rRNA (cytosine967-C5)-methyltransferase
VTARGVSPARAAAVGVLRDVLEKGKRATPTLADRSANLGAADANLMRELTLGVLRWKSALDLELASSIPFPLSRLAPNLREILEVALYQIRFLDRVPNHAAVDEAVRQARESGGVRAAKFTNAVLRNLLRSPRAREAGAPAQGLPLPRGEGRGVPAEALAKAGEGESQAAKSLALSFSHPEFLVARWIERFGLEATRAILQADNQPSDLDLLTNSRQGDREALARALEAEGIETEVSAISPLGLSVKRGNPLRSPLFAAGRFTVQDVGAQALPLLMPAGDTLLDLAAAPGGKSFAALLLGRARHAIALDRSPGRLRLLWENRRRLQIEDVHPAAGDVKSPPLPAGGFERVLFDAPCSGTGTLRKNPEIRYRVTPAAVDRLALAQREGLRSAARLLAPGGYLLYSTCSLEREENEAVVDDVLSADPTLELAPIAAVPGLAPFVAGARFQMLPSSSSDGFTAHLLRKRKPGPSAAIAPER